VALLIGIALLLGAFYGLTHSITGAGTVWARLAWGVALIGVGLGLLFVLTEIIALPPLAAVWANSSGVEKDLALAGGAVIGRPSSLSGANSPSLWFWTRREFGSKLTFQAIQVVSGE
jgi:hypothetical protein